MKILHKTRKHPDKPYSMNSPKKIILFGGQGSLHLFSSQSAFTAAADAKSSTAAAILLSRCHAVFLEDLHAIGATKSKVFGNYSKLFVTPESLLSPDASFHDNPIIQGTTIALQQLLRYLQHATESASSYETLWDEIQEVAGFCSGVLPAAVVCVSRSVEEFIEHAVEAFRLALWTGYRSAVYCEQLLGRQWKDLPWSMVIYGLDRDEVSARLEDFKKQVRFLYTHVFPQLSAYYSQLLLPLLVGSSKLRSRKVRSYLSWAALIDLPCHIRLTYHVDWHYFLEYRGDIK